MRSRVPTALCVAIVRFYVPIGEPDGEADSAAQGSAPVRRIAARKQGFLASSEPGGACVSLRTAMGVRREKAALSSGCKAHPANRSSRKQPEQSWRQRNDLYELHRVKSFFALWLQTPT